MKKLFKSKLFLSLLASSFVLATGLVGVRNMNSSYAMQSKGEIQNNNLGNYYNLVLKENLMKDAAYYAAYGRHLAEDNLSCADVTVRTVMDLEDKVIYFYKIGEAMPFNSITIQGYDFNFDDFKFDKDDFKFDKDDFKFDKDDFKFDEDILRKV